MPFDPGDDAYTIETVVAKRQINTLIPEPKHAGATGIIEIPIAKIILGRPIWTICPFHV